MDINKLLNDYNKKITILVEQRNSKKKFTIIIGLPIDLDLDKILTYLKKTFSCNGFITDDEINGKIITLNGEHKDNIYNFIIENNIGTRDNIIIKGI